MLRLLALASLSALAAPLAAQSFDGLGDLPGGDVFSQPTAVNADGSVVVGTSYAAGGTTTNGIREPFRWENGEMIALEYFPGQFTTFGVATGISADGSVISGVSSDMQQSGQTFVRWVDTVLERLTVSAATDGGGAADVSDDGSTVVGIALRYGGGEAREAFRWTETGSQGLGTIPGANFSFASGVSGDGSVVVGSSSEFINEQYRPFRWEGTMQELPVPAGAFGGDAADVTADGSVIVGSAFDLNGDLNARVATRWVGTAVEVLPAPPTGGRYYASGVSDDGAVVVGGSFAPSSNTQTAWIWTEEDGTRTVESVLADLGLSIGGWRLTEATAISADGRVVVGNGLNPDGQREGWRAVLTPGAIIVVNASGDEGNHPDSQAAELCDVDRDQGGEQCTLRAAIELSNARDGRDVIEFDLDGGGTQVLSPEAPLPALTDAVLIDGSTQPGTVDVPLIRLDGALAGADADGLLLQGDDVAVRGLLVTRFGRHGLHVASGENGVLEGLVVGSDASGADGLGNGGDGIHVSGGSGLRIGRDEGAARSPEALTPQARAVINFGVLSLGNLLNGLYVRDEQNAALIRAQRRGESLRSEARFININVNGLTAGLGNLLGTPVARPNGQNGVCLLGARGVTLKDIVVSDALRHALEIDASQDIRLLGGRFGMRKASLQSTGDLGSIGESVIRLTQSIGVQLGSESADDAPVEGGASGGWFMDVEDSEQVEVRNVLGGLTTAMDAIGPEVREALRNLAGGLRVMDSPDVRVGLAGLATVFANNGGDATQPQAGVFASGAGTTGFRMVNTHLGTTPSGLMGLGNLGSGLHLEGGLADAVLGGDDTDETVVSGGNGGYGFLFQDLSPEAAGLAPSDARINILSGTNLASGLMKAAGVEGTIAVPNVLSGFCLNRVQDALLNAFSSGPNGVHGVEVIDSERVELESGSVGSYWQELVDADDDVMGPEEDGISIVGGVDISVGRRLESDLITNGYLVYVVGAGGRAMYAFQNTRLQLANWAAGVSLEGSAESDEIFDALGNSLEAAVIEESEDVVVENVAMLNNGSESASGIGGLLAKVTTGLQINLAQFGETLGEDIRRENAGAALGILGSTGIGLTLSRILGGDTGVEASNSSWFMEDNTFEGQGALSGGGAAVVQSGGSLSGIRNLFRNIDGAAVRADGAAEGVLRFNSFTGTEGGVLVDGGRPASGASGSASGSARGGVFIATENWWGDASGPSGEGPGAGASVSPGVDFSDWLTEPFGGVVVRPDAYVVEAGVGEQVEVRVTFSNPLGENDRLDVSVSDERRWLDGSPGFPVNTFGAPVQRSLYFTPDIAGASEVTIRATSRNDATRSGVAVVRIVPRGSTSPLASAVPAGATTLPADGDGLLVGGSVVINPGGATQETGIVTGFGSILLQDPTRFAHAAGEVVVGENALAVDAEAAPLAPEARAVRVFPNPSAGAMAVEVATPEAISAARVAVHDALGREVAVLHDGPLAGGTTWPMPRLAPGVYVVRAVTPEATVSARATVVR